MGKGGQQYNRPSLVKELKRQTKAYVTNTEERLNSNYERGGNMKYPL